LILAMLLLPNGLLSLKLSSFHKGRDA